MNKKILAIAAIVLFLVMAFIPAATADIKTPIPSEEKTPPPQPQWILSGQWAIARIRGPMLFSEGYLLNVETLDFASSFKIGNSYFYKDVHVIGTIDNVIHRSPSFTIGRWLQNGKYGSKVSVTASLLINNKPLEIQEDGKLYFFSTVFNAKLEELEE